MSGFDARLFRQLGMTAALCGLLACSHAPSVPEDARVTAPVAWRTPTDNGPAIDSDWWRNFNDPVLQRLVDTALAHNVDIALAAARVREARAQEKLSRSQLFPTLDARVDAQRSRDIDAFGEPLIGNTAEPQFAAAYEVDLFGRVRDNVSAARSNYLASDAAREATRLSVAAATTSNYITLRALDARLGVARQTLQARNDALNLARRRAEVGYTSTLELRQAEAEFEAAAQAVPQAELAVSRQENALSILIGVAPTAIECGSDLFALTQPQVPGTIPADLLRQRPDLAQAEYTLAGTDASLAAARKQYLPQIKLGASIGRIFNNELPDPITVWSLGGSVLAPIFEGGRIDAQVDTALARRDQAAFNYQKTALTAFREVEDNLAAEQKLREQFVHAEAQRNALAETLRVATNRYRAGYAPYLEQLDAQRGLYGAELSVIQTRADLLNALVALYQALGGGWDNSTQTRAADTDQR
ncbi:MAG: efflux transporter outer rane subunit [Verrucomicrobiaceae bacterium]|nr:efflux transporter outer rane subunit [Verrucomicrobiaceae bacterium]